MDGKNTFGILGLIITLILSIGGYYLAEKNPFFLVLILASGFGAVIYIAYEIAKNPERKDLLSLICLGLIPFCLCALVLYALSNNSGQNIYSYGDKSKMDRNYQQETSNAERAINDFHKFLNERNCEAAYALFTARYRNVNKAKLGTVDKFTESCRDVSDAEVIRSESLSPTDITRRFRTLVSWKQKGKPMQEDTIWGLEYQGGKWLIDTKLEEVK
ncbi:MAG: hypothetical protein WA584_05830 [Pyrinomonadaceae bacterium]